MKKAFLYLRMISVCVLVISGAFSDSTLAAERGWLGIEVQQVTGRNMRTLHMQYGRWQVVSVSAVAKGSPAEQIGIKPEDVILSVNYKDIKDPAQFAAAVNELSPDDKIVLLVSSPGEKARYLSGTVGKQPADTATAVAPAVPAPAAGPAVRPSGRGSRGAVVPPAAAPSAPITFAPAGPKQPAPPDFESPAASARIFAPTGSHRVVSIALSPDGRHLLSGGDAVNSLKLWDIATGREVATLKGHTEPRTQTVAFSPDGRYALSGSFDKTVKLWDVATGREVRTFTGHKMMILSVAFSPDGKYAASGSRDSTIKLWEVASGKEVRTFSGTFSGHSDGVKSIAFSPDGRFLLSGSYDKTVKLWEVSTGDCIRTFTGHTWQVQSVAFSPDGKRAFSRAGDRIVKIWDVASGSAVRTLSVDDVDASGKPLGSQMVLSGTFSPDGRRMSTTNRMGNINVWDIETGKPFRILRGHIGYVQDEVFSRDGARVVSGGYDGSIRIWDLPSGREIAQFISLKDGEWIALTPEGYYNCSLNAHKYLNIRLGGKVYGIDQFYDVFYRPDIVAARLRGDDISGLITLTLDEALRNPPPTVEVAPLTAGTSQPKVKVCYAVKSTGGGIGEVRVFHNGKLIRSDGYYREAARAPAGQLRPADLNSASIYAEMRSVNLKGRTETELVAGMVKGGLFEDCTEIDPVAGENEVSVSAFNGGNSVQSPLRTVTFSSALASGEPHLYILSIGIDRYRDAGASLRYAVKDARELETKIRAQSATIYRPQNIHYSILTDAEATKANILRRIGELAGVIKPGDSFILFVAGHGVLLQNQYYMLTHDFSGQVESAAMISSNEIVEMSKKIRSLSQLFIFDTCHAGGVDTIVSGLYDARMSVLAKKMGLHIYASASDRQAAMDGYRGNGLFTHTLLDGLNNNRQADRNRDGRVTVVGLGEYSKRRTTEISRQIGHSQTPLIINFGKDSTLYELRMVKGE